MSNSETKPKPQTTIEEGGGDRDASQETYVLELDGVTKTFDDTVAADELSLAVREGELLTILGPSGCGKTTSLRLMAGLERPDEGVVRLDGRPVAGGGAFVEPENRDVGIVFQDYALFPHLSVEENVAFGLNGDDGRVTEMLELVGLTEKRGSSPEELSGGEKQRVALARSLAPEPRVLLLDEPFSNLDVGLRVEMREEVRRILKEAGVTAVSVTHDQEEALSISDRIAVMRDGEIMQVGRPERVFQQPESRFVADFLGNASFISGVVRDGVVETAIGDVSIEVVEGLTPEYKGAEVEVLVRPDDVVAIPVGREENREGEIVYRQYYGPSFVYRVELDNGDVVHCMHNHVEDFELGTAVKLRLVLDHPLAWYPSQE